MSTYGIAVYGVDEYNSNINTLEDISRIYIGCEPANGREANGIFDEFQLWLEDKTDGEIEVLFNASSPSSYTTSHQLLAHFDSNIDGGNLTVDGVDVAYWRIFRKKSNESQYQLLSIITNDSTIDYCELFDYDLANNTLYDYAVEGVSPTGVVTNKYELKNQSINFKGIWLVDKKSGNVFNFRYNIPELQTTIESDRTEIKTFSKYPIVIRGEYKVKKGSLQGDAVYYTNKPSVPEQIKLLESFEGSDGTVLKFDNGEIFKADIYNLSYTRHPETDELSTVRCDYVQTGEAV